MTGARVKRVQRYIDDDTFMVTYGDGVANIDIDKLLEFHRAHGKLATVTSVRPISRFGILNLTDSGHVQCFSEKPRSENWINAGFFVFNRDVFDYLEDNDACVMESGPLERLAANNQLVGYRHEGFFFAMDTFREFEALNRMWNSGQAPWRIWEH